MFSLEITVGSVESLSRDISASVYCQAERNTGVRHYAIFAFTVEGLLFVNNINQEGYRHSGR